MQRVSKAEEGREQIKAYIKSLHDNSVCYCTHEKDGVADNLVCIGDGDMKCFVRCFDCPYYVENVGE